MYILIPLLLIPQLILSGVVVKFDKLNPAIGNTETVPFVGDLMASRWAFEAAMVTQFKDNRFEKEFYIYDKVMADADFKKVYFIPELETKLQFCLNNFHSSDSAVKQTLANNLELIRNETSRELSRIGTKPFARMDDLVPARFDSTVYVDLTTTLEQLKKYYVNRYNAADQKKEAKIRDMIDTPEKEKQFELFREQYHNETI